MVTVIVPLVVMSPVGSTFAVVIWLFASAFTSKVVVPAAVLVPVTAVAVTVDELDVALMPRQVLSEISDSAAVLMVETRELTAWYELTAVWAVETLALSRVCGAASTCI